jgi:hypothetical protein
METVHAANTAVSRRQRAGLRRLVFILIPPVIGFVGAGASMPE